MITGFQILILIFNNFKRVARPSVLKALLYYEPVEVVS